MGVHLQTITCSTSYLIFQKNFRKFLIPLESVTPKRRHSVLFVCYIRGKHVTVLTTIDHVKLPQASHEARKCRYRR